MMPVITVDERIANTLQTFPGETIEEKTLSMTRSAIIARTRECEERILEFEARYGMTHSDFAHAWEDGQIPDKHSHEVETDYIQWEAMEMEKQQWLAALRDLTRRP